MGVKIKLLPSIFVILLEILRSNVSESWSSVTLFLRMFGRG